MTRVGWIAVGCVSALAFGLAVALAISLASGDDERGDRAPGPELVAPGGLPSDEFRECMSEQGVETPDPQSGAPRAPDSDLQGALEACEEFLPEGAPGPGGGVQIMPSG